MKEQIERIKWLHFPKIPINERLVWLATVQSQSLSLKTHNWTGVRIIRRLDDCASRSTINYDGQNALNTTQQHEQTIHTYVFHLVSNLMRGNLITYQRKCISDIPYVIHPNQNRITYDLKIPTWLKAKTIKTKPSKSGINIQWPCRGEKCTNMG